METHNDSTNLCHETNNCIKIEATYKADITRFCLPLGPRFELKQELATRFKLELDSFNIKCLDDDHEWTCDDNMQDFVDVSRKSGKNILHLIVTDREIFQEFDDGSCENQVTNESSKRKAEEGENLLISGFDDLKHFGEKLNDVVETLKLAGQQLTSLAESMASHKRNKVSQIDTNLTPHNVSNVDEVARKNDAKIVTFKVKCFARAALKFPLRLKSTVAELEENIRSRLKLGPGKLTMMYQDEDLDYVLISSDEDFQFGLETLTLGGCTTIKIQCHHINTILKI